MALGLGRPRDPGKVGVPVEVVDGPAIHPEAGDASVEGVVAFAEREVVLLHVVLIIGKIYLTISTW